MLFVHCKATVGSHLLWCVFKLCELYVNVNLRPQVEACCVANIVSFVLSLTLLLTDRWAQVNAVSELLIMLSVNII